MGLAPRLPCGSQWASSALGPALRKGGGRGKEVIFARRCFEVDSYFFQMVGLPSDLKIVA